MYEVKFLSRNMDVAFTLDREMMIVSYEVPEILRYVKTVFQQSQLRTPYPAFNKELSGLLKDPSYDNLDEYRSFIRRYFIVSRIAPLQLGRHLWKQYPLRSAVAMNPDQSRGRNFGERRTC